MGTKYEEPQLTHRSVFVLSKPAQFPAFHALSSLPTPFYWGLLVSPLVGDELREAMRFSASDKASIGTFWEVCSRENRFITKMNTSFSMRDNNETTLLMEYCGKTVMSDSSIIQEVDHITDHYSHYELRINNYQMFTRYFVDAICLDCPPQESPPFPLLWLPLFRMPLQMQSESPLVPNSDDVMDRVEGDMSSPSRFSSAADRVSLSHNRPSLSADEDVAITKVALQPPRSSLELRVDIPDDYKHTNDCLGNGRNDASTKENSVMWEFRETQYSKNNVTQGLHFWILPLKQSQQAAEPKAGIVTLMFDYFSYEFLHIAWVEAIKQFASFLGQKNYFPDSLINCYNDALAAWEDNADKQPGNPIIISQLAWAYATLGDIDVEIAGWWRLLERHPGRLSFLNLLYQAWIRKNPGESNLSSLLSFWRLCFFFFLSRKAETAGFGHLDWWPLAGEEELMLFRSNMGNRSRKNERVRITSRDWVKEIASSSTPLIPPVQSEARDSSIVTMGKFQVTQSYQSSGTDAHNPQEQETDPRQKSPPEKSRYAPQSVPAVLHHRESHVPNDIQDSGSIRESRVIVSSESSSRVKYVPIALCFYDRLLEVKIDDSWSDREVMQEIQREYWKVRGAWKKWPSMWKIWPGKKLHKIGYAKMRVFRDTVSGFTLCDKLECYPLGDSSENNGPTDYQWRKYFHHPEECPENEVYLRNSLPKTNNPVRPKYQGHNMATLYFEHSLAVGVQATMVVVISAFLVLYWAIGIHDISGGFGAGAFVFGLIAVMRVQ